MVGLCAAPCTTAQVPHPPNARPISTRCMDAARGRNRYIGRASGPAPLTVCRWAGPPYKNVLTRARVVDLSARFPAQGLTPRRPASPLASEYASRRYRASPPHSRESLGLASAFRPPPRLATG